MDLEQFLADYNQGDMQSPTPRPGFQIPPGGYRAPLGPGNVMRGGGTPSAGQGPAYQQRGFQALPQPPQMDMLQKLLALLHGSQYRQGAQPQAQLGTY